ncbi:MAG: S24 family peptidase [Planctomycetota bacterium]
MDPQGAEQGRERVAGGSTMQPVPLPREVPLINSVTAGQPTEFTDLGYPARVADDYVRVPDLADPDAFAARVVGDSMQPEYLEGDVVVFSPAARVESGSDCFARLEPDQETTFKRVYFEAGEGSVELIRLQPLNARYAPRTLPRDQVAGLYRAVTVMRAIGGG